MDIVTYEQMLSHLMIKQYQRIVTGSIMELDLLKSILLEPVDTIFVQVGMKDKRTNVGTEIRLVGDHEGPTVWEPRDRVIVPCTR